MDYAILLAAGQGTRMKSTKHKVLHEVCGKPIIEYALELCKGCGVERSIVVVGHNAQQVCARLQGKAQFAMQDPAKGWGTGAAARAAEPLIDGESGLVYIMVGDAPLFTAESMLALRSAVEAGAACAALTTLLDDPFGYGRVIRDESGTAMINVIEQPELTDEQKAIREVNVSLYCMTVAAYKKMLPLLPLHAGKNEYYLTDLVPILTSLGEKITPVLCPAEHALGINDRVQLAQAEKIMQKRILERLMRDGVTIKDPDSTYIDADVEIGMDTVIWPGCILQGQTKIGTGCTILQNCRMKDATIGDETTVESSTLLSCKVGSKTTVGPNAYLRPNSVVGDHCRIGDFVELKNATIGNGTKVSHLTYVGDADLGEGINLGCGVVFSNYDGKKKYRSTVDDGAFIGCNVNLVSPVHVGKEAYLAAGSTITQDVPEGALSIARQQQSNLLGWVAKRREKGLL